MSRILLCVSASAAIYKACDLASKLYQAGHELRTLLTPRAAELISPQLFEAVSSGPATSTEFGPGREGAMDHIEVARFAELVVVAPCTADLVGRLAHGLAGDLVSTALLAVSPSVPRLLCPAMNPVMLASAPVQRNLGLLREDGWQMLEPEQGHMACGEQGAGRLVEPARIVARVEELLP
jgi:phosphopantothenoylcysteine synthetase/decarboxylase